MRDAISAKFSAHSRSTRGRQVRLRCGRQAPAVGLPRPDTTTLRVKDFGKVGEFLNEKRGSFAHTRKERHKETDKMSALVNDGNLLKRLTEPRKRACRNCSSSCIYNLINASRSRDFLPPNQYRI